MFVHRALTLIYFCATTFLVSHSKNINVAPRALIDEAKSDLETVKNSLISAINTAHIALDTYYERFKNDSSDVETEAQVVIEYEGKRIFGEVEAIQESAGVSGRDVSDCLDNYQNDVANFTSVFEEFLSQCINIEIEEAAVVIKENRYLIDIEINRVNAMEFELGLCDPGSVECIAPIYDRIQLEKQYGTDNVDIQLIKVNNLLNKLKAAVQDCENLNVTEFVGNVNAVLRKVNDCADVISSR